MAEAWGGSPVEEEDARVARDWPALAPAPEETGMQEVRMSDARMSRVMGLVGRCGTLW